MSRLLWEPTEERKRQANVTRFLDFVSRKRGIKIASYDGLWDWSVNNIPDFWADVWQFVGVKSSSPYSEVVDDLRKFPGATWFRGARMNFAENLLRYRGAHTALVFRNETGQSRRMSYSELYSQVARLAAALRQMGIQPGDRVAAYMPNLIETAVAMLAATSAGAVWTSCATDLGPQAALDRLAQVDPKVLFTVDGYFHKGKVFSSLPNARLIASGIPSLKKTVMVGYVEARPDIRDLPSAVLYDDLTAAGAGSGVVFNQAPFDHPAVIMFSSGTTGKPKCMVQSGGGVLLNHLKELVIHSDLKREDTIFYITSCSWMMWNWLLSSLAVGATVVLYDGNPMFPDAGAMWRLVQDEGITVFGLSASYVNALRSIGAQPGRECDLSSLREISQTGSPLSAEGFEYVYQAVKEDLHFNSIAGGTDINGCFFIGNPAVPVFAGQLQKRGLGMKVACYDEQGRETFDRMGELVCEAPSPSMPLYFWGDANNEKYLDAYFRTYPGVWRHGDHIVLHSDTQGATFLGRSDAVLKPSGVRIGTAEIYNQVERIEGIADSLAVGQEWKGDQRIILFVKLAPGYALTDELKDRIRKTLRQQASPRHVPAKVIETPDIPYTLNMKKVEGAVANIVHGRPVTNRESLANPECLDYYVSILPLLQRD